MDAYYPECTEDWASSIPASNVYTSPTAYHGPSSYSWPECPLDCPLFQETNDFLGSLLSKTEGEREVIKKNAEHANSDLGKVNLKDIFIIHGHDEANKLKLQKLLIDEFKLNPIVLSERAGKGRTLIEKFEKEAATSNFAFAIITPDDTVKTEDGEYAQARPNVVFELGWFCGRLGRNKTCILLKKGTKIHSDLDGVFRIEFADSVEEKFLEIKKELKATKLIR